MEEEEEESHISAAPMIRVRNFASMKANQENIEEKGDILKQPNSSNEHSSLYIHIDKSLSETNCPAKSCNKRISWSRSPSPSPCNNKRRCVRSPSTSRSPERQRYTQKRRKSNETTHTSATTVSPKISNTRKVLEQQLFKSKEGESRAKIPSIGQHEPTTVSRDSYIPERYQDNNDNDGQGNLSHGTRQERRAKHFEYKLRMLEDEIEQCVKKAEVLATLRICDIQLLDQEHDFDTYRRKEKEIEKLKKEEKIVKAKWFELSKKMNKIRKTISLEYSKIQRNKNTPEFSGEKNDSPFSENKARNDNQARPNEHSITSKKSINNGLCPEAFEKEKQWLIGSTNFAEEARKLLEAPLRSSQIPPLAPNICLAPISETTALAALPTLPTQETQLLLVPASPEEPQTWTPHHIRNNLLLLSNSEQTSAASCCDDQSESILALQGIETVVHRGDPVDEDSFPTQNEVLKKNETECVKNLDVRQTSVYKDPSHNDNSVILTPTEDPNNEIPMPIENQAEYRELIEDQKEGLIEEAKATPLKRYERTLVNERTAEQDTKRAHVKSNVTSLDFIEPSIGKFIEMYLDYKESKEEEASSDEGDELLLQVSGLSCESLEELFLPLEEFWDEAMSTEDWKVIFSQQFPLIKTGTVTEFPLIISILLFVFNCSSKTITAVDKAPELKQEPATQIEPFNTPELQAPEPLIEITSQPTDKSNMEFTRICSKLPLQFPTYEPDQFSNEPATHVEPSNTPELQAPEQFLEITSQPTDKSNMEFTRICSNLSLQSTYEPDKLSNTLEDNKAETIYGKCGMKEMTKEIEVETTPRATLDDENPKGAAKSSPSVFGGAAAPSVPAVSSSASIFTAIKSPPENKYIFGGSPAASSAAPASPFGGAGLLDYWTTGAGSVFVGATTASSSTFGGATTTTTTSSVFGGASKSSLSVFGGAATSSSAVSAPPASAGSVFGSSGTSVFGKPAAAASSGSIFGGSSATSTSSPFRSSTSAPSVFGAAAPSSASAYGVSTTSAPAFEAASVFGAASTPAPSSAPATPFGAASSVFGGSSKDVDQEEGSISVQFVFVGRIKREDPIVEESSEELLPTVFQSNVLIPQIYEPPESLSLSSSVELSTGFYSSLQKTELIQVTTCKVCKRKFTFTSMLLEHLSISCDKAGIIQANTDKKTKNQNLFICAEENCSKKKHTSILQYAKHRDTHSFPGLVCAFCDRAMSSPADMVLHVALQHPQQLALKGIQDQQQADLWRILPEMPQILEKSFSLSNTTKSNEDETKLTDNPQSKEKLEQPLNAKLNTSKTQNFLLYRTLTEGNPPFIQQIGTLNQSKRKVTNKKKVRNTAFKRALKKKKQVKSKKNYDIEKIPMLFENIHLINSTPSSSQAVMKQSIEPNTQLASPNPVTLTSSMCDLPVLESQTSMNTTISLTSSSTETKSVFEEEKYLTQASISNNSKHSVSEAPTYTPQKPDHLLPSTKGLILLSSEKENKSQLIEDQNIIEAQKETTLSRVSINKRDHGKQNNDNAQDSSIFKPSYKSKLKERIEVEDLSDPEISLPEPVPLLLTYINKSLPGTPGDNSNKCSTCNMTFKTAGLLRRHQKLSEKQSCLDGNYNELITILKPTEIFKSNFKLQTNEKDVKPMHTISDDTESIIQKAVVTNPIPSDSMNDLTPRSKGSSDKSSTSLPTKKELSGKQGNLSEAIRRLIQFSEQKQENMVCQSTEDCILTMNNDSELEEGEIVSDEELADEPCREGASYEENISINNQNEGNTAPIKDALNGTESEYGRTIRFIDRPDEVWHKTKEDRVNIANDVLEEQVEQTEASKPMNCVHEKVRRLKEWHTKQLEHLAAKVAELLGCQPNNTIPLQKFGEAYKLLFKNNLYPPGYGFKNIKDLLTSLNLVTILGTRNNETVTLGKGLQICISSGKGKQSVDIFEEQGTSFQFAGGQSSPGEDNLCQKKDSTVTSVLDIADKDLNDTQDYKVNHHTNEEKSASDLEDSDWATEMNKLFKLQGPPVTENQGRNRTSSPARESVTVASHRCQNCTSSFKTFGLLKRHCKKEGHKSMTKEMDRTETDHGQKILLMDRPDEGLHNIEDVVVNTEVDRLEEREGEEQKQDLEPESTVHERLGRLEGWSTSSYVTQLTGNENAGEYETREEIEFLTAEVRELLFQQPHFTIPLCRFIPAYKSFFNKSLVLANYGFSKLKDLLSSLNLLTILGNGNDQTVTLRVGKFGLNHINTSSNTNYGEQGQSFPFREDQNILGEESLYQQETMSGFVPRICSYALRGRCRFGQGCLNIH